MKVRGALVVATMLTLPVVAQAQAVKGLYIGAGAGLNLMQDENAKIAGGVPVSGSGLRSKLGAVGVLSLGYGFGNGLRAEIEGSYRYNGNKEVFGPGGTASTSGKEQKFGVMVNALYDFVGLIPAVTPYVGIGVGYQAAMIDGTISGGGGSINRSTKGSFAYQAMVGAALPIDAVPGLSLTAEYRFMGMNGNRSYGTNPPGGITFDTNYNHSALLGVRYAFGAAPAAAEPAPQAPPAAQATRSYLVFFDWDKATLTDSARSIIASAAENSSKVAVTRIEVNGYADTSGKPQYNQGLSVRRAQAVAAELVKRGVARNAITIQGYGDTKLLVATGPNVREPKNRRVEIILR